MKTKLALQTAEHFARRLTKLHELRRQAKRPAKRSSLTPTQRNEVWKKTAGRCHICGGKIGRTENWQADHVLAHTSGGKHSVENYLPAHQLCNNYRWFYGPEEFQWILKLGVWLRTLIERRDSLAMAMSERFVKYEEKRILRQRSSTDESAV